MSKEDKDDLSKNWKEWEEKLILDKDKIFESGKQFRGKKIGNRTYINLKSLKNDYKLKQAYASVRNLEFRSDVVIKKQFYEDYRLRFKDWIRELIKFEIQDRPQYSSDEGYRNTRSGIHYPKGDLLIIVEEAIYNNVKDCIDQYVLDVCRDGYWAIVYTEDGGTHVDLRNFIIARNPVGVLLIGNTPVAWYEHDGSQFPCDLYFMDTDGSWTDSNNDGVFDDHDGNIDPSIWVGRIWTPAGNGNDVDQINDYFARNHKFRLGELGHERTALSYVDDDWTTFNDCEMDEMFPSSQIEVITNTALTDADRYKAEVNASRSWVQLCAHSWFTGHSFEVDPTNETIHSAYFRDTNPPNAHFYNLFCCGPGRFTVNDYLAGWYIFDQQGGGTNLGLTAVASAKSGSMLFFADFYKPLGQGKDIGSAFVDWWNERGPNHEDWERDWFYGLVLIGDPTLTWWKGAVPQHIQPQQEDSFDHWPRRIEFNWTAVDIPGVTYTLEVDAFGAINSGQWADETRQVFVIYRNITTTKYEHFFVGAQRGRWRVRAQIGSRNCSWSPWRYFRFTV